MNKLRIFALVAGVAGSALAETTWWTVGSYASIRDSLHAGETWYDLDQAYVSGNLDGAYFGSFDITTDSLYLKGELNVGSDEGNVFTGVGFVWRVNGGGWTTTRGELYDEEFFEPLTKYQFLVSGIDLVAAGQIGLNTLDVLAVREHSWQNDGGGSYTSYMGYDTAGSTVILTEGVDPITQPTGNFFTSAYTLTTTSIPEPATMSLLGLGILALNLRRKIGT